MKKTIILLFLLCSFTFAIAQEKYNIDYAEIENMISDEESDYFYPKLLERYNGMDSTLSLKEYVLLYYGFSFQPDYLINQPDEAQLDKLLRDRDFDELIKECEHILSKSPVSLKANTLMAFSLFKLERAESESKSYQTRYAMLRNAILCSGDGESEKTAFHTIYVSDEYDIMRSYFRIRKIHSQKFLNEGYDYFEIDPSEYYQKKHIYFDISRSFNRRAELLKGNIN